jgi:hypothetical protein
MIELTEQQQRELAAHEQEMPPRVHNPSTKETFVLLPATVYERVQGLLEAEEDERFAEEMAPLIWEVMKEDWEDPALDVYDNPSSTPKHS